MRREAPSLRAFGRPRFPRAPVRGGPYFPRLFMAIIKPFAALRPRPELAARLCELPYDVMSSDEARALATGNPLSFLHVSKPEIDLPPGTDLYAPEVYAKGKENFARLIAEGALRRDAEPRFYYYRQIMGRHQQTGLVAAASCADYLAGVIKKHELTRPDKEDDRVRHIETLNAQTGPAFLTYRAVPALDELAVRVTAGTPEVDFTAADGVRHSAWTVMEAADTARIVAEFARIPGLYIADGHHRSAAAGRIFQQRRGENPANQSAPCASEPRPRSADLQSGAVATRAGGAAGSEVGDPVWGKGGSSVFLAVIFPHNQMQILPYHRVLKDLNGLTTEALLTRLASVFEFLPAGAPQPGQAHHLSLYLAGGWHALAFRAEFTRSENPIERLDVSLLQRLVLAPVFGIDDPRTSQRIGFVGGIRGSGELKKLVDRGDYACAFALHATGIEDLMAIADAGGIMPPKSTWFEPKLRDGMFCHLI